jgi:hypothetical protein
MLGPSTLGSFTDDRLALSSEWTSEHRCSLRQVPI